MNIRSQSLVCFLAIAVLSSTELVVAGENVLIVLDDSGSMNEKMAGGVRRIDAAKSAIAKVLQQFPDDTKLGLMLLNGDKSKQHWAIPLEPLSVVQAIKRVNAVKADGGTPLGERMREGADALLQLREKQLYGNYRLLIVTDGEASDKKQLESYLPDVLSRGLVVDAIGVDMRQDHSLATRVHSYRRADDADALSKAVQEVFAEKVDSGATNSDADFALLQALDDLTAQEALSALSKPNNAAIASVSSVYRPKEAIFNNAPNSGNANPTPPSTVSTSPANATPPTSAPPGNASAGISVLTTIMVTIATCLMPLLLIVMALIAVLAKANRGPKPTGGMKRGPKR